jgi:hypothetical protein
MRLYGACLRGICSQFETDSQSFPRYHYEHGGDIKVWENLRRRHLAESAFLTAQFAHELCQSSWKKINSTRSYHESRTTIRAAIAV